MLILTGLVLVAAAGFLVMALITGPVTWAWASIAASGLAAIILVARWWRLRRSRRASARRRKERRAVSPEPSSKFGVRFSSSRHTGEPEEEDTDAADRLVVGELTDEVIVVDERPRYHSEGCRWLGTRPSEALAVSEARDLGFTPCAGCRPDAELARRHRAASTS